jgi:hypothetical protein
MDNITLLGVEGARRKIFTFFGDFLVLGGSGEFSAFYIISMKVYSCSASPSLFIKIHARCSIYTGTHLPKPQSPPDKLFW